MAQRAGGTVVDEPPRPSRRERREERARHRRAGRSRRSRAARPAEAEPAVSEGRGSSRRERRRRAQRRRFWVVVMPAIALVLAAVVGIGMLVRADDGGGTTGETSSRGRDAPADTLLLTHTDSSGRADLLVVVGTGGDEASVLLLPAATQVEVPSLGVQTLADLPVQGDDDLLRTTIENMLGVRIGSTLVVDDAELVAQLALAEPLTVEMHRAVRLDEEVTVPSGTQELDAATAARVLTAPQPGSELDRLVTVQDVLDAWMDRLRDERVAAATVAARPELGVLVDAGDSAAHRTDTLPVESIATGGGERFEVRRDALARYVDGAFANALLAPAGERPRVEILNGTGAVGVAQGAAAKVVPAGGEVTLTGNVPGFGVATTQVVYYRDAQRADAQRLLDALGCGVLKKAATAIGVVDVTVIVGADCPAIAANAG